MDDSLQTLAEFPRFLERALDELGDPGARARPAEGAWSLVEQLWHLADLEREGYGVRIARLLAEEGPVLADFDGDAAARERDYRSKDPYLALERFTAARRANVARFGALTEREWARAGTQAGVGALVLLDLPRMMRAHDAGHRDEIEALLSCRGK